MKSYWCAVVLGLATMASAATVHVDAMHGHADGDGSSARPFNSLARASMALQLGDVCDLHTGVYHETLRPAHSGAPDHPITYQPAGDGPVTLDGADEITQWHRDAGDVYASPLPVDLGSGCNQIFVDGHEMVEARWPHVPWDARAGFDLLSAPFAKASIDKGSATLIVPEATQPKDFWRGATVWAELGDRWTCQTATVVASSPGKLTLDHKSKPWFPDDNAIFGNQGFVYLSGLPALLTAPGEFFCQNKTVRLITVDRSDPGSHHVEARTGRWAIDLAGRDYITVIGLHCFAGSATMTGSHCILQNCTFHYVTHDAAAGYASHGGINIAGQNNQLQDCIVDTSTSNGVILNGSDNVVSGCTIANVDSNGDYSAAVVMGGHHNRLEHSTLTRAGRALVIPAGTGDVIQYNDMSHAMLLTQDGGAFYTWKLDSQGTVISHNWVHDIVPLPGSQGPYDGIYLDDGCKNFIVDHNVVWNTKAGIRLGHIYPASGDRIYHNTLWGNLKTMNQHGDDTLSDIQTWSNLSDRNEFIGTSLRANLTTTDARFVNVAAHDFRLQADSPAVDFGQRINGINDRFAGKSPDAGAYEAGGESWTAGAPAAPR